jgi:NADPH:quinone reductase-like Zn-dependent oxidoreductase
VSIRRHGGPEVLELADVPLPAAALGDVTARVTHVGVNHLDTWVRRGVPGHDFHLPRIPGSDVAVEHEGQRFVLHPSWGCGACAHCLGGRQDRCAAFRIRGESADGGCAARVVVPRWMLLPIPGGISPAAAASMPLTLLTAWHMMGRAGVQRGERVLVQAGASGVGVMAIQVARLRGAEVHATASSEEKRAVISGLGARAWTYGEIGRRDSGAPRTFDVVVETVGADTWAASTRTLAWGGRLVCCGATSGASVPLDLRALFFKQQQIIGSTMGSSAEMIEAWSAVARGEISPVLDSVMPMSRVAEAHARLESRAVAGKIVLEQDLA